jgi:murein DD-endopeptidase MepM/ murein hydrolase activator NlpD
VEGGGHAGWLGYASTEGYLAELRAYDALLSQHANAVGATVFTMGQFDDQWMLFNVGSLWPRVVAEQEASVAISTPISTRLPIEGARVSQRFGEHPEWYPNYRGHPGVDLACPTGTTWHQWHGTAVRATIAGRALTVDDTSGYGLYVYVAGDAADELLAHLSGFAVENGQEVQPGQIVGYVGYTGNCKPTGGAGTHLHWGIRPRPYRLGNGYRGYVDPLA